MFKQPKRVVLNITANNPAESKQIQLRNAAAPSQSDVSQRLRQRQWEPSEFHHPSARQLDAPAVFAECQLQHWQPDMSKTTWACRAVPNARCCSRTKRARVLVVENLANPRVNNQKCHATHQALIASAESCRVIKQSKSKHTTCVEVR